MQKTYPHQHSTVQTKNGGWLAISARCEPLRIGVAGDTPEAAKALLAIRLDEWKQEKADYAKSLL